MEFRIPGPRRGRGENTIRMGGAQATSHLLAPPPLPARYCCAEGNPWRSLVRADEAAHASAALSPGPSPASGTGENSSALRQGPWAPPAHTRCHPEAQAHGTGLHSAPGAPKDLAEDTYKPGRGSGHHRRSLGCRGALIRPRARAGKPAAGKAASPDTGRCRVTVRGFNRTHAAACRSAIEFSPLPLAGEGPGERAAGECAGLHRPAPHPARDPSLTHGTRPKRTILAPFPHAVRGEGAGGGAHARHPPARVEAPRM